MCLCSNVCLGENACGLHLHCAFVSFSNLFLTRTCYCCAWGWPQSIAWQALREAFLEASCTGDALLAADLVARFYRSCACDTTAPDIADAREAAAEVLKAIQHRFFEERGGKLAYFADGMSTDEAGVRCCGAKVHLEMGGSQPVLLGGSFNHGSTQAAWHEAHLVCPRYFGQCQQTSPFAAVQQDMLLHMLFGDKLGGVFVDVGTVDGFSFSNTYFFERNLNWTGVCVEPNRASLDVAQRVRSKAAVYNSCVANESSTQDFVQCTGYTRMLSGLLSSMTPQHHQRIRHEIALHGGSSQVVKVPVQRLGDILVREGIGHVDVLSIDTEGAELQVS